jgi:hypothetical protein
MRRSRLRERSLEKGMPLGISSFRFLAWNFRSGRQVTLLRFRLLTNCAISVKHTAR